jgi:hypothetical protein
MKKLIGLILFSALAFCMFGTTDTAQAAPVPGPKPVPEQVIYSRKCCDNSATVRCILVDWTPVGNPCFCYGQGWGYTC